VSPRRALSTFAVLIVVSLHAPASAGAAPVGDCVAGAGWPAPQPSVAADVVTRVNAHRAARGLVQLAVSPTLTAAAEWKARHMAEYRYMQHDDPAPPVQRAPSERMHACGYPERTLVGENIAMGYDSAASVMEGWLGSAGHRANIERAEFRAIGVGVARSAAGSLYWAQEFGSVADAAAAPPPAPPPPPTPPPVAVPPPAPAAVGSPLAPTGALRVRGCRRARPRVVTCRLAVSWGPVVVRARLSQRGAIVASGSVRARRAGRVRVVMRARRALRPGRAILRARADGVRVRRAMRVR
jgi:uncharacterized protein YkwD